MLMYIGLYNRLFTFNDITNIPMQLSLLAY